MSQIRVSHETGIFEPFLLGPGGQVAIKGNKLGVVAEISCLEVPMGPEIGEVTLYEHETATTFFSELSSRQVIARN